MRRRLLIVEDEQALARAMAEHFRNRGFDVDFALEFEEAAALLANVDYDLLLTDLRLGALPGVEGFLLVLETRTVHPDLPIIMLTGFASTEMEDWTLSYPHSAFLRKPISLSALEAQVCGMLEEEPQ